MMSTVGEMPIDKLTVIDKELAANGSNFAVKAAITAEQLKQMLGVDVAALAQRALPRCARRRSRAAAAAPADAARPGRHDEIVRCRHDRLAEPARRRPRRRVPALRGARRRRARAACRTSRSTTARRSALFLAARGGSRASCSRRIAPGRRPSAALRRRAGRGAPADARAVRPSSSRARRDRGAAAARGRRPRAAAGGVHAGERVPDGGEPERVRLRRAHRRAPRTSSRRSATTRCSATYMAPHVRAASGPARWRSPSRRRARSLADVQTTRDARGGRPLPDARREDLHLRRRSRPHREHRAPDARAHRGRAAGHQGRVAVLRAEAARSRAARSSTTTSRSPASSTRSAGAACRASRSTSASAATATAGSSASRTRASATCSR